LRKKKSAAATVQAAPPVAEAKPPHAIDELLGSKLQWIVAALLVFLFAAHSWHAAAVYLNPDEALHYRLAHQPSAAEAYLASNTNAHPPLLVMSLHYWIKIGNSEWFLRLLPLLCSMGMVAFAYLWGKRVAGPEVGITFAMLLAFMPPLWELATEVRHYPLAMCFACGALYFVERGLNEGNWKWTAASAVSLWLAVLSNYSVLWFAAGFGVYSLWRVWQSRPARSVMAVWAAGQVAALGIYGFLWVSHISKISDSAMSKEAREGWLSAYYCKSDTVSCLGRNTLGLFEYLSGHPGVGVLGCLLFLAGLAAMWARSRGLLILIGVQFAACWAAVAAGLYPFGGSRHSVVFAIPVALALSYALGMLAGGQLRYTLGIAGFAACAWLVAGSTDPQAHTTAKHAREFAEQSITYLQSRVPKGGMVFTDHQARLLLCYYADREGYCNDDGQSHFWQSEMKGYRVISSRQWSLGPDEFVDELRVLKKEQRLERGAEVWLFDGGWGEPLNRSLALRFGGTALPGVREFGENLTVFRIPN